MRREAPMREVRMFENALKATRMLEALAAAEAFGNTEVKNRVEMFWEEDLIVEAGMAAK